MEPDRGVLTDAYLVGLELRDQIRDGITFCNALRTLDCSFGTLDDSYPEWHPEPYPFHGVLKLFLYRETTGDSYQGLTRHPELAAVFGLERILDEEVREFITTPVRCLVKEIHDRDLLVLNVRPKEEVLDPRKDPAAFPDEDTEDDSTNEFTDEEMGMVDCGTA